VFTPGGSEAIVRARAARRFAERVHAGVADRYGAPLLDHVRRVAAAVPVEACAVAWLHEVFEHSTASDADVRVIGATDDELQAIRLLTRDPEADDRAYLDHVARIAAARGRAGELARAVKVADLQDRLGHHAPDTPDAPARPAYDGALALLAGRPSLVT